MEKRRKIGIFSIRMFDIRKMLCAKTLEQLLLTNICQDHSSAFDLLVQFGGCHKCVSIYHASSEYSQQRILDTFFFHLEKL